MMFKARGTLDTGENFSFPVDAPNFVVAIASAANIMQTKLMNRAGAVTAFSMKFQDGAEGFKLRKSEKKAPASSPAPAVADAPIPATASVAAQAAKKK